jgi:hypothetical protein
MLSLPNSGSTWFAATLAKNIEGCRYFDKEFFNPVCNIKHELVLREQFGSELVSCYRNIAFGGNSHIHDDIANTWGKEDYTFTKECQSPFKLPIFMKHFTCFAFLRRAEHTFPPGRVRVWSFYEHAWYALREAGHHCHGDTLEERAREAHAIQTAAIIESAELLGVPIIWWEDVFKDPRAVTKQLQDIYDVRDSLTDDIIKSAARRMKQEMVA